MCTYNGVEEGVEHADGMLGLGLLLAVGEEQDRILRPDDGIRNLEVEQRFGASRRLRIHIHGAVDRVDGRECSVRDLGREVGEVQIHVVLV